MSSAVSSIEKACAQLRAGGSILLLDDASASGAAYLIAAAESITPDEIAFHVNSARGLVCAALPETRARALGLPPMVRQASGSLPPFTVSIEARQGVSTGISCSDRAATLRVLSQTADAKRDLVMPGHIFPIVSRTGGVLVKSGAPEAAVDLLTLAGITPVAVLSQCLDEKGDFASLAELQTLAAQSQIPLVHLTEIVQQRLTSEVIIERIAEAKLPSSYGAEFRANAFRSLIDDAEHLALVKGSSKFSGPVLVRVQTENRLGDLLGMSEVPSRQQIAGALRAIAEEGEGVFVYVRHPRRELLARQVEEIVSTKSNGSFAERRNSRSRSAALREYGVGAQILSQLGVREIRLLTNSEREIVGLEPFGLKIVERVPFALGLPDQHESAVTQALEVING